MESESSTLVAYKEKYTEKVCFYFDSDFIKDGYDIAPLQAPINGVTVQRGLPIYGDEREADFRQNHRHQHRL